MQGKETTGKRGKESKGKVSTHALPIHSLRFSDAHPLVTLALIVRAFTPVLLLCIGPLFIVCASPNFYCDGPHLLRYVLARPPRACVR
jgi:hypothetical protein